MERPVDEHRLCLVRLGRQVRLELWLRTGRKKSPWDRLHVATMEGAQDGLALVAKPSSRVEPYEDRIKELLPEFEPTAVVEAVSLR